MEFLLVYSISLIGLFFLIFNTFLFVTNKKVKRQVPKIFLYYLVLLSITEISCNLIGILKPNSNLFISHFYFGFQFICLSILYHKLIDNKLFKKAIVVIGVVQIVYLLSTYISNTDLFWTFHTYEIVSTSIILIIYILFFLIKNVDLDYKYFNFSIGLFLYLSSSIAIFLSGNLELVLCTQPYIDIWVLNSICYILFQLMVYREYLYLKKLD